jgi:hypothetical protein
MTVFISASFRVSDVDNRFLELYSGLQSQHLQRCQAYLLKCRMNSIDSPKEEPPDPAEVCGIDPAVEQMTHDEVGIWLL